MITFDEAHNLGYGDELDYPCGPSCGVVQYNGTDEIPTCVYNSDYVYFTMSFTNDYIWQVDTAGNLNEIHVIYSDGSSIRPVLEISKSADITKL